MTQNEPGDHFRSLVQNMREAQDDYFEAAKSGNREAKSKALQVSQTIERTVDDLIRAIKHEPMGDDFRRLVFTVLEMRRAQNQFFKTGHGQSNARNLERQVDDLIEEHAQGQGRFF